MTDPHSAQPTPYHPEEDAEAYVSRAGVRGGSLGHGPPDLDALEEAFTELEHGSEVEWRAFGNAFVANARACHAEGWTGVLGTALSDESAHLKPSWQGDEGAVRAASKAWSEETDPSAVWSTRHLRDTGATPLLSSLAPLLLGLDASAALRALERLPYPQPLADVLDQYARHDPDRILDLIASAEPAFDSDGCWGSEHPIVALVATNLIVVHATNLLQRVRIGASALDDGAPGSETERTLRCLEAEDLPIWLRRAFRVVMQRGDGACIALRYLTHLIRAECLGSGHRGVVALSIAALAEVLRESSVGVERIRRIWHAIEEAGATPKRAEARPHVGPSASSKRSSTQGEGSRKLAADGLPALLGAAAILGDEPLADDVADVWAWFETLLVGRDPALFLARQSSEPRTGDLHQRVARLAPLFARLPDPSTGIRSAYSVLEPQRRRLQFRRRYDDHDTDLPSILLLRLSLAVATRMASDPDRSECAKELLLWAYRQSRRLWLIQPLDAGHERAHLAAACFAAVPAIFSHDPDEALGKMVPPIANDPVMLSNACWMLASESTDWKRVPKLIERAGGNATRALQDTYYMLEIYRDVGIVFSDMHYFDRLIDVDLTPTPLT